MIFDHLERPMHALPANIPCSYASVRDVEWEWTIEDLRTAGATFLTLWGTDDRDRDTCFAVRAAFLLPTGMVVLSHKIRDLANPTYPSIAQSFPAASRMERSVRDLLGISSKTPDRRGWLNHNVWPILHPLRRDLEPQASNVEPAPYSFVHVEGDGVHEIAVGPVHAGTIEPGHFRFSVVGEKVLRLEERFGYTHKGVAKLFESLPQSEGHRLAARLSGDSAVAFSWAYCAALESITATECPPRASLLRALALEHERIANHLGDLGALGNDAGFAYGLTQFSRLKEDFLRANQEAFGERYLFGYIIPGGVVHDLPQTTYAHLLYCYRSLEHEVSDLRTTYNEHGGLQDRFRESGQLSNSIAVQFGAVGLIARASGLTHDLRIDHPCAPYKTHAPNLVTETGGDVAARVQVRFGEIFESLHLCRAFLADLSHTSTEASPIATPIPIAEPNSLGIGIIEGWRGPVLITLETGSDGAIRRCHAHDPSGQNWPLLEHAILGNIVPDFPLINKSFNLSYSGQDG